MKPTIIPGSTTAHGKLRDAALDRLRELREADRYWVLYGLVISHPVEALDLLHQLDQQERHYKEQRED